MTYNEILKAAEKDLKIQKAQRNKNWDSTMIEMRDSRLILVMKFTGSGGESLLGHVLHVGKEQCPIEVCNIEH